VIFKGIVLKYNYRILFKRVFISGFELFSRHCMRSREIDMLTAVRVIIPDHGSLVCLTV